MVQFQLNYRRFPIASKSIRPFRNLLNILYIFLMNFFALFSNPVEIDSHKKPNVFVHYLQSTSRSIVGCVSSKVSVFGMKVARSTTLPKTLTDWMVFVHWVDCLATIRGDEWPWTNSGNLRDPLTD